MPARFAQPLAAQPRRVGVDVPGGHEADNGAVDVQLVEQGSEHRQVDQLAKWIEEWPASIHHRR
jgi:hypothetical protein